MSTLLSDCAGECDWNQYNISAGSTVRRRMRCGPGSGTCLDGLLRVARPSEFHPIELVEATATINQILMNIPADPEGRKLSFVSNKKGVMLAWVEHEAAMTPDVVTAHDDPTLVTAALGLAENPSLQE